jgi:tetratricopeptide (TPR) repeat protein
LLERALEDDPRFVAAHVRLAEAWMDLEQPVRAGAELQRAAAMRPRWQRVASHDSLLEQAGGARLRGDLTGSARLYKRAISAVPPAEAADLRFGAAAAKARAGDIAGAIAGYATLAEERPCRGVAILALAILSYPLDVVRARLRFEAAVSCFESGGDLDGLAQSWCESGRVDWPSLRIQPADKIAQASGNVEQQILTAALTSEELLENGDDEASYESFAKAMQLADSHGLPFFSVRLLSDRAAYFFAKGDFLQAENFNFPAWTLARSANMPWTYARCAIRRAKLQLISHFPNRALNFVASAEEPTPPISECGAVRRTGTVGRAGPAHPRAPRRQCFPYGSRPVVEQRPRSLQSNAPPRKYPPPSPSVSPTRAKMT